MAASIDIRYYVTQKQHDLYCYALRVVATAATDMPEEIFVYQRNVAPAMAANTQPTDQFVCLADPVDFEEIPLSSPDLAAEMPYYRVAEVTLLFRDMTTLAETKGLIDSDIQLLVDSINAVATMDIMETKTYV